MVGSIFAASSEPYSFPDGGTMPHMVSLLLLSAWFISYQLISVNNGELS